MQEKALVIIDIQNDITPNYKDVIANINAAIDWAVKNAIHVIYIRHENLSFFASGFKPDTHGSELAFDLKIASPHIFTKHEESASSSAQFADFIRTNKICEFYLAGADAVACVNATCSDLREADYSVSVLSDCITSYDKGKIDKMLRQYESKGATILRLTDL